METVPKRQERVALWDNLKFFLILFVVIGHFVDYYIVAPTFQSIFIFIYAEHKPIISQCSGKSGFLSDLRIFIKICHAVH